MICPELSTDKNKRDRIKLGEEGDEQHVNLSNHNGSEEVVLQTLMIKLKEKGKERPIRALIDTGSQRSYILKSTAEEMGYKPRVRKHNTLSLGEIPPRELIDHTILF